MVLQCIQSYTRRLQSSEWRNALGSYDLVNVEMYFGGDCVNIEMNLEADIE